MTWIAGGFCSLIKKKAKKKKKNALVCYFLVKNKKTLGEKQGYLHRKMYPTQ